MKDYYKILGVEKNASSEEIKKAFYRLAHKYHPDKGGDPEKFKEINEAYQVLSNKEKRAQYDRFGTTFDDGAFRKEGFPFDFDFSSFGATDFGDLFENIFEGFPFKKRTGKRGKDIVVDVEISLDEAFSGVQKQIKIQKYVICPYCQGTGAEKGTEFNTCPSCRGEGRVEEVRRIFLGSFTQTSICPQCDGEGKIAKKKCRECNGEGRIKSLEDISFFIPAGISNGESIKISDKGEAGIRGQKGGDFFVRIHIKPHPCFRRKGDNIFYTKEISFSEAVFGGKITIPCLDGKVDLKIPKGVDSGEVFIIKGKGMPRLYSRTKGDMFIRIKIKTPKKLTKKQEELLKKLKEEGM